MSKKTASRVVHPKKSTSVESAGASCVVCSETLDITQAADMHAKLSDVLAARQPAMLDASAVQQADTAVLQVMCAFVSAAEAAKIPVTWQQPSEAFCRAAGLLGLHDYLGLQEAR